MESKNAAPIRGIGITLGSRSEINDEEIIKVAQAADSLGYTALFEAESWGRDALTTLTMLACRTQKILLGTGIISVYSRTPTLIAQSIASLDSISGGRAILGLGTSSPAVVEQWHGVPYNPPMQRSREYIEIIRLAVGGLRVDYQGKLFKLNRFHMAYQGPRPHIPIWLASLAPKSLELTGELADGWLPIFLDLKYLPRMWEQIEKGAKKSGRSLQGFTNAPYILAVVTKDREEGLRLVRDHIAFYAGGMGTFYRDLFQRYGFVEEAVRIHEAWTKGDRARALASVTEAMAERIAIFGNAQECRTRLQSYYAAGVHLPLLTLPRGAGYALTRQTLEALAPAR